MFRILTAAAIGALAPLMVLSAAAAAAPCPGNPHALGTERVVTLDAARTPRVGRKQFPQTLPLKDKELVLTFDDGPWPTTTPKVLDALAHECVRATFFLLGRNVAAHPALARRERIEGHSIGHHTYSHRLLNRLPPTKAEAEIERGIAADDLALYGRRERKPAARTLQVPRLCLQPGTARLAAGARLRGVRRRRLGQRLERDDA